MMKGLSKYSIAIVQNVKRDEVGALQSPSDYPIQTRTSHTVDTHEALLTCDVVHGVVQLSQYPRHAGLRQWSQPEPRSSHESAVHEDNVDAGDVQGHPGRQHDARLRLPEVVHERQRHEDGVVHSASDECQGPHHQVGTALCAKSNFKTVIGTLRFQIRYRTP